jgi:hypothetical protein
MTLSLNEMSMVINLRGFTCEGFNLVNLGFTTDSISPYVANGIFNVMDFASKCSCLYSVPPGGYTDGDGTLAATIKLGGQVEVNLDSSSNPASFPLGIVKGVKCNLNAVIGDMKFESVDSSSNLLNAVSSLATSTASMYLQSTLCSYITDVALNSYIQNGFSYLMGGGLLPSAPMAKVYFIEYEQEMLNGKYASDVSKLLNFQDSELASFLPTVPPVVWDQLLHQALITNPNLLIALNNHFQSLIDPYYSVSINFVSVRIFDVAAPVVSEVHFVKGSTMTFSTSAVWNSLLVSSNIEVALSQEGIETIKEVFSVSFKVSEAKLQTDVLMAINSEAISGIYLQDALFADSDMLFQCAASNVLGFDVFNTHLTAKSVEDITFDQLSNVKLQILVNQLISSLTPFVFTPKIIESIGFKISPYIGYHTGVSVENILHQMQCPPLVAGMSFLDSSVMELLSRPYVVNGEAFVQSVLPIDLNASKKGQIAIKVGEEKNEIKFTGDKSGAGPLKPFTVVLDSLFLSNVDDIRVKMTDNRLSKGNRISDVGISVHNGQNPIIISTHILNEWKGKYSNDVKVRFIFEDVGIFSDVLVSNASFRSFDAYNLTHGIIHTQAFCVSLLEDLNFIELDHLRISVNKARLDIECVHCSMSIIGQLGLSLKTPRKLQKSRN